MIRRGLQIPSFSYPDTSPDQLFERVATIATTAEDAGFDSVWVMDHLHQIGGVGAPDEPMLEAYVTLGALAARTSRLRLGTLVTGVPYRNPALLAKIVTTLDVVSAGRALLGIGASWNAEEAEAYGYDYPGTRERLDRLEEALQICRAMFGEAEAHFDGANYRVHGAINVPRPVQAGGIPILVGGGGERRTLRLVARYGDACNLFGGVDEVRHKLAVLDRHCEDVGRDPAAITRTKLATVVVGPTAEAADAVMERLAAHSPWGADAFRAAVLHGDPAMVAEQARVFLDAGLDGLIVNLPEAWDLETVALTGQALRAAIPD